MRLKSIDAEIHRGFLIQFQKPFQTAAVIIMPVGENGQIHRRKIHSQPLCVDREILRLSRVKQNPVSFSLQVQTQPVFRKHIRNSCSIFH